MFLKRKPLAILLLLLVFLAGCGRSEEGTSQPSAVENETEAETVPNRPQLDWRTDVWKCDTLSGTTYDLYITEFISDLPYTTKEFDVSPVDFDSLPGRFYELDCCTQWLSVEEQKLTYYLSCYEDGSSESWHQELVLPEPEQFGGDLVTVRGLDVLGAEEYVLFLAVY
ncbi:MAG: hypothetical protein NC245_16710, partial [Muribaculum sp.]|nr:hypothetical protein [Muribaculum sp.]